MRIDIPDHLVPILKATGAMLPLADVCAGALVAVQEELQQATDETKKYELAIEQQDLIDFHGKLSFTFAVTSES